VIERTDRVRVIVNVPQQYALRVEPGCPANVELNLFPGKTWSGTVSRTAGFLNPASLELKVEVDLPNSNGQLMSGMMGRATITLKTPPQGG
jgi:multidrug efflux pump subunit AcrA (membrane-fusion protein)